jgi:DNA-binding XRE family transcriptional regulator
MTNSIKRFRKEAGLTQRALAEKVKTTQQQIQRIESGAVEARFRVAVEICAALGQPLDVLFPRIKRTLNKSRAGKTPDEAIEILAGAGNREEMAEGGIDTDSRIWTFKYRLRGGRTGYFTVSSKEKDRLFEAVQAEIRGGIDSPFVVVDSEGARIGLNRNHLSFCHFLWDADFSNLASNQSADEDDPGGMLVYLADSPQPVAIEVEADSVDLGEQLEEEEGPDWDNAPLQGFFDWLEMAGGPPMLGICDVDGEYAFFRAADIAMVQIPLWALVPGLSEAGDELDELLFAEVTGPNI